MEFYFWIVIHILLPILFILYFRKEKTKIAEGKLKQLLNFALGLATISTIVLTLSLVVFLLEPTLIPISFETISTGQRYTVIGCLLISAGLIFLSDSKKDNEMEM
ncbi:hypothetical protein bcgnr5378_05960 [Bacillus cereus]|uniref:Group-specific protein n=1 Tax=Bacillus cereus TaxID=1396 RepID=A0A164LBD8_BACCE|nr:hypothetical protein [Bacillus cereus]KZD55631.1 hypothetical protein B4088_5376 [Bacillus cereus]